MPRNIPTDEWFSHEYGWTEREIGEASLETSYWYPVMRRAIEEATAMKQRAAAAKQKFGR